MMKIEIDGQANLDRYPSSRRLIVEAFIERLAAISSAEPIRVVILPFTESRAIDLEVVGGGSCKLTLSQLPHTVVEDLVSKLLKRP